ncbi:MAG: hypothetical protein R3D57_14335 [Hyphomicrobiaceae bacterium]
MADGQFLWQGVLIRTNDDQIYWIDGNALKLLIFDDQGQAARKALDQIPDAVSCRNVVVVNTRLDTPPPVGIDLPSPFGGSSQPSPQMKIMGHRIIEDVVVEIRNGISSATGVKS